MTTTPEKPQPRHIPITQYHNSAGEYISQRMCSMGFCGDDALIVLAIAIGYHAKTHGVSLESMPECMGELGDIAEAKFEATQVDVEAVDTARDMALMAMPVGGRA